jgi:glycosyltransferase involved in cell wall biosynthesis
LSTRCIALLGRKDTPTDALEEYCRYLAAALQSLDIQLGLRRVSWEIEGWPEALGSLERSAAEWRDTWVLVQYTALAWSARGFPQKVLLVMHILKSAGARVGIVFHDVEPYPGSRLIDSVRRSAQIRTMRRALSLADLAIFTVRPEKLSWPPMPTPPHASFIPVGANLPIPAESLLIPSPRAVPTIGVFGITGGDAGARETQFIVAAVRQACQKVGKLRLSVFGRHAELRQSALHDGLHDLPVEVSVEGVVEPDEVVQRLSACDVLLFVRGNISSRRGSAIAGIACGLPVIAFSGSETATPITDAGVILIPSDQPGQLNDALVRVISDSDFRAKLSTRSRAAYQEHFSWNSIARCFAPLLALKVDDPT